MGRHHRPLHRRRSSITAVQVDPLLQLQLYQAVSSSSDAAPPLGVRIKSSPTSSASSSTQPPQMGLPCEQKQQQQQLEQQLLDADHDDVDVEGGRDRCLYPLQ